MVHEQVTALVAGVLGESPRLVTRMPFGHNSVTYDVALLSGRSVIVRTNDAPAVFAATERNIAILAGLGLPVPRVLASDLTRAEWPYAYMILEKIPGRDLRYEIADMSESQMTRLAEQVVSFQKRVATLPPGEGYGYVPIGSAGPHRTWQDLVENEARDILDYREESLLGQYAERARRLLPRFVPYFAAIPPTCFLDDITIKNVIVMGGRLQGLIDFDVVCYGDPLFMVGLTAAGIVMDVGERELFYAEELCRAFAVTAAQKRAVTLYASLFLLDFLRRPGGDAPSGWRDRAFRQLEKWMRELETDSE